ncbi:hypothetical protein POK33_37900 [Burkholderia cenocepacia]|uniref:hypothetical protein n=1 Tax=Burkholderia cenocepacia TaxID=95486 RepID=UPI0023B94ADA|nr:hypothetical protein [Burkholderia cenocepacia]MDF0506531.1 hypothetical protein [Burkholderia cenocepacia]
MTTTMSRADALTDAEREAFNRLVASASTFPDHNGRSGPVTRVGYTDLQTVVAFVKREILSPVEQPAAAPIVSARWIAFTDAMPPVQENGRGDMARRKVLVTNNINARDAFGDPSHVWIGSPVHDEEDGWRVPDGGKFLTHWMDPFATSANETGAERLLRRARDELSLVEWENDPPTRVIQLFDDIEAYVSRSPATAAAAPADERIAVSDLPHFPTMLRKMWSGTEVQQWINDNIKPLVQERHHDFHCGAISVPADERAAWFSIAMNAAASLEDAANWLTDPDSKRSTLRAAVFARKRANALWKARAAASPAAELKPRKAGYVLVPVEPTQAMLDRGYWPCVQGRGAKSVWGEMLRAIPAPQPAQADAPAEAREPHSDDVAVDSFSAVMKHKLALARDKGRGGWETCSPADLSRMLREHVEKGDPRDVANFCMMLWHHGSPIVSARADAGEAAIWKTTHRAVCVPLTEDRAVAEQWRAAGYPVIEYFTAPPAARVARLTDEQILEQATRRVPPREVPKVPELAFSRSQFVDVVRSLLRAPQPAQADAPIDIEAMLCACVPGGDICDPQRVADSIREWFAELGVQADAQAEARPSDDALWDQTLQERDQYHDMADKLARAIATHLQIDIGEHSNLNCPWEEALEAIENAAPVRAPADAGEARLTDEQYDKVRLGLTAAKHFIANGIELGFIRMPDADCPDPAHNTPKLIDEALALLNGADHAE